MEEHEWSARILQGKHNSGAFQVGNLSLTAWWVPQICYVTSSRSLPRPPGLGEVPLHGHFCTWTGFELSVWPWDEVFSLEGPWVQGKGCVLVVSVYETWCVEETGNTSLSNEWPIVCISSGCHNKVPPTRWCTTIETHIHASGGWGSEGKVSTGSCFLWRL